MAFTALHFLSVGGVHKDNVACRLDTEGNIPDRMAAPAVRKGKCDVSVAGTARLPLSHFSHGHRAPVVIHGKNFIMTSWAIVVNVLAPQMYIMAETDVTPKARLENDSEDIRSKCKIAV
jgi:hypothetical protein